MSESGTEAPEQGEYIIHGPDHQPDPEQLESTTTNDFTPTDDGGGGPAAKDTGTSTDDLDINKVLEEQERQREELREPGQEESTTSDDVSPTEPAEEE